MNVVPRLAHEAALRNAAAAERHEDRVQAWIVSDYAQALERARAIDAAPSAGPLAGRLIGIKDIIDVAGYPTRCGSPIYESCSPSVEDAASVALIREAGGIIAGKTATTEFAYFAPSRTTNPYNVGCTPGGSSSGSAAAVATGMVEIALGTQTAASVTRPASFCGIYGFKPSFGTYSLSGAKTLAHSLDTLGTLARSVADIALMHAVLARQSADQPAATKPRIGFCKTPAWPEATPDCVAVLGGACRTLQSAGAEVTEVDLPSEYDALADAQMLIMAYDAARDLAYEAMAHGQLLSPQIRDLIDKGRAIPAEDYAEAQRRAAEARLSARALFDHCDVILAPAAPGEAPAGLAATGDPIFSRMWTLLQLPTICVPGFEGAQGLPIGVQFLGPMYGDRELLDHAAWIEAAFRDLEPRYRSAW
jgi:Asp-tRNA(Asn)/Glu-tRNA(Gln) amidotransferase A subunit family amidase